MRSDGSVCERVTSAGSFFCPSVSAFYWNLNVNGQMLVTLAVCVHIKYVWLLLSFPLIQDSYIFQVTMS